MAPPGANKPGGRTNRLVALSSAAVLTVYAAGYLRTRAAAERLQLADRGRVVIPEGAGDWSAARVAEPETPRDLSAPPAEIPSAVNPARARKPGKSAPAKAARAVRTETPVAATTDFAGSVPATPVAATPVATTPVAVAASQAPASEPAAKEARYKDGTYTGWGTSRHGDIEATVVIANGRITSARISQCWTRYSCSWVAHLQGQVVDRQSPEVDYVSGATQSTNAFYYAVVQALSKAK
ncbi:MAG TPA: FMN-binding protein [Vicinamibacterales bacterium]|nr:FMN-binding protein [Vicinamibacterales bacterium]